MRSPVSIQAPSTYLPLTLSNFNFSGEIIVSKKSPKPYEKIDALFSYRMIPWMLKASEVGKKKKFLKRLRLLQDAIYQLDAHLESHWQITRNDLRPYWIKIFNELEKFGIDRQGCVERSKEILTYQARELGLRDGNVPISEDMDHFYFYKSCDVKLMRRLIYEADPTLEEKISAGSWADFDLITEVNDDIDDIFEDMLIFNASRFLFSVKIYGVKDTRKVYEQFIRKILKRNSNRLEEENLTQKERKVARQTLKDGKNTLKLLKKQCKDKRLTSIGRAKVFKYMPDEACPI